MYCRRFIFNRGKVCIACFNVQAAGKHGIANRYMQLPEKDCIAIGFMSAGKRIKGNGYLAPYMGFANGFTVYRPANHVLLQFIIIMFTTGEYQSFSFPTHFHKSNNNNYYLFYHKYFYAAEQSVHINHFQEVVATIISHNNNNYFSSDHHFFQLKYNNLFFIKGNRLTLNSETTFVAVALILEIYYLTPCLKSMKNA